MFHQRDRTCTRIPQSDSQIDQQTLVQHVFSCCLSAALRGGGALSFPQYIAWMGEWKDGELIRAHFYMYNNGVGLTSPPCFTNCITRMPHRMKAWYSVHYQAKPRTVEQQIANILPTPMSNYQEMSELLLAAICNDGLLHVKSN